MTSLLRRKPRTTAPWKRAGKVVSLAVLMGVCVGAALAGLFLQSPGEEIKDDLRRLKQLMETGECPTTEGQPRGRCGR